MRIICISDTHCKHYKLNDDLQKIGYEENDIIIHAGDCTSMGYTNEVLNFLKWFGALQYEHKIFIAGNHDFYFEEHDDISDEFKAMGIIYLMDQMVEVNGLKIYGSPWQPEFNDWAFNVSRGNSIAKKWKKIPNELDILITHGPAYGILDDTIQGLRVGCEELYKKIMIVKPKIHICGHIHYGRGYKPYNDTAFVNASSLDESYDNTNKPIVLTLDNDKDIVDINLY